MQPRKLSVAFEETQSNQVFDFRDLCGFCFQRQTCLIFFNIVFPTEILMAKVIKYFDLLKPFIDGFQ